MRRFMVLLAVCMFVFAGQSNVMGDVLYDVVDLTAGLDYTVRARAINDNGEVVGILDNPTPSDGRAVLFDSTGNGQHIYLGTLGGIHGQATDINEGGVIVGWSTPSGNSHHVTLFDSSGAGNNIDIGRNGYAHAVPYAINDLGKIVGSGFMSDDDNRNGVSHAVLFDETGNGNNVYLGTLGGMIGAAVDINNAGVIVGVSYNSNGYNRGVVFNTAGGNNFDLGTLGGMTSRARDINESGQIIGVAANNDGNNRATLFETYYGGDNIDLGTLGGDKSKAAAINEFGEIVGWAIDADGNKQATMFDPTGAGANLNLNELIDGSLNINLAGAVGINNNGQIICYGFDSAGNSNVYLLNQIPEPATLLLLGFGGLVLRKRRN